jgi:hypothetical protein
MSVTSGPDIIDDNLLIHLDAANDRSYPGTGATWYDISGLNNNISLINGPVFSASNNGTLVFDGVNDYGTINLSGVYTGASFSTWFKTNEPSAYISIGNKGALTGSPGLYNGITMFTPDWASSTIQIYLNDATGINKSFMNGSIGQNIRDNIWHNLIVTYNYNGSTSTLVSYLDGLPKTTVALAEDRTNFFNYTQDYHISRSIVPWNGQIAHFSMYNKTLTANEVRRNFNALRGRFGI